MICEPSISVIAVQRFIFVAVHPKLHPEYTLNVITYNLHVRLSVPGIESALDRKVPWNDINDFYAQKYLLEIFKISKN